MQIRKVGYSVTVRLLHTTAAEYKGSVMSNNENILHMFSVKALSQQQLSKLYTQVMLKKNMETEGESVICAERLRHRQRSAIECNLLTVERNI